LGSSQVQSFFPVAAWVDELSISSPYVLEKDLNYLPPGTGSKGTQAQKQKDWCLSE
jgi:hypothetical protein